MYAAVGFRDYDIPSVYYSQSILQGIMQIYFLFFFSSKKKKTDPMDTFVIHIHTDKILMIHTYTYYI